MRVLLVDDEQALVSALAERLGFRGIKADFAVSADEALALASGNDYDIAVLDVKMPGMGGIELRTKLCEVQPELGVIFVTGHGSANDFQAGASCGEAYLVKPVGIDTLVETFDRIINCKSLGK